MLDTVSDSASAPIPATPNAADPPTSAAATPAPVPATLHEARSTLPQLIKAAAMGTSTPLARGTHHALLTAPDQAARLGWDLTRAPVFGTADARKKLGDLIQHAAEGHPQVLRRHTTPVAVLVPATATGTPVLAAEYTTADTQPVPDTGTSIQEPTFTVPTATAALPVTPVVPPASAARPTCPVPDPSQVPEHQQPTQDSIPDAAMPEAAPAPPTTATPTPPHTQPPTQSPTASTAATAAVVRAPRRLAALAQALDDVLTPTTTASGETAAPATLLGLSTGIRTLDDALGGLQPGRFYLIAAAPGAGSSLIATAAARTAALDHHQTVLYAASGLSRQDVAARVIAAHLPVDYRRLRSGRLTTTEQQDVAALHSQLTAAPLYIDDGTDLTVTAIAESVPEVPDLALVVVDRLQRAEDPHLPLSGTTRITDAAQALAHLARTHHLPVLAAVDTDDPHLLATLALDVTVTLTRDADQIRATVTERDLGLQDTLTLHADLAHARITDPTTFHQHTSPHQALADTPPTPPTPFTTPHHTNIPGTPAAPATPTQPYRSTDNPTEPVTAQFAAPGDPQAPTSTPAADQPTATTPHRRTQPPTTNPATAPKAASTAARSRAAAKPPSAPTGGYAGRDYSYFTGMIASEVDQALQEHDGDTEAATQALIKHAIPNAMALFEATRVGANYEHTVYPEILEFLRKKVRDGVDEIWEGRHNWNNTHLLDQLRTGTVPPVTVDVLDTNASFLSAFKTHLPIGTLVHQPDGGYDPKRSGIYHLDQRPAWNHTDLPDPIGNRHEEGPILLDDATIRLLARCARHGLCEAPVIAECWTSGASEGLLEKFRRVLTEARENAVKEDDTVTVEYIKAMYSKFTSTMGESSANLEIRRPEWMHIVRSQAFANLWYKAYKAYTSGLVVVRVRGTDELHVTGGDWRNVFDEGRLTSQMKVKDQYLLPRKSTR